MSMLRCRIRISLVKKCWFERSSSAVSRTRKWDIERIICGCWGRAGAVEAMTRSVRYQRQEEGDRRWENENRCHMSNLKIGVKIITSQQKTIPFYNRNYNRLSYIELRPLSVCFRGEKRTGLFLFLWPIAIVFGRWQKKSTLKLFKKTQNPWT